MEKTENAKVALAFQLLKAIIEDLDANSFSWDEVKENLNASGTLKRSSESGRVVNFKQKHFQYLELEGLIELDRGSQAWCVSVKGFQVYEDRHEVLDEIIDPYTEEVKPEPQLYSEAEE